MLSYDWFYPQFDKKLRRSDSINICYFLQFQKIFQSNWAVFLQIFTKNPQLSNDSWSCLGILFLSDSEQTSDLWQSPIWCAITYFVTIIYCLYSHKLPIVFVLKSYSERTSNFWVKVPFLENSMFNVFPWAIT